MNETSIVYVQLNLPYPTVMTTVLSSILYISFGFLLPKSNKGIK